ncbi:MAG: VLRF1 family aeRF1-type release factor [Vulcanimicrobiota bacterium]
MQIVREKNLVDQKDLKELLKWHSDRGILSIYLSVEARERNISQRWKAQVRSRISSMNRRSHDNKYLDSALDKAQSTLMEIPLEMRKRSLVYIHDVEHDRTFIRSMQIPLENKTVWMETPFLRPLVSVLDESPVLGIVVVCQELARVITWRQGLIEADREKEYVFDIGIDNESSPASSGVGRLSGSQTDLYEQKIEVQRKKELARLAHRLVDVARHEEWQSIMLIGDQKLTDTIEENLPVKWQQNVIGKLDKNLIKASLSKIEITITSLLKKWKRRIENKLVENVINTAMAGGKAVTGVQKTIDAVEQYRVERLLFASDLQVEGYKDEKNAIMIELEEEEKEGLKKENYVIERLIELCYEASARVTPIEGKAAEKLKEVGGLAGFLRY